MERKAGEPSQSHPAAVEIGKENGSAEAGNKGLVTAIAAAIVSAVIAYAVNFISDHRRTEIEEVNMQIGKLYGPLYAYSVANQRAWIELHGRYRKNKAFFDDKQMPDPQEVEVWRRWMKNVFMPINLKMESVIVENSQLLEGNKIYPSFVDFLAHVEAYKATLAKWKDSDDLSNDANRTAAANTSVLNFPENFENCVEARLRSVLHRKKDLEASWTGYISDDPTVFNKSCN